MSSRPVISEKKKVSVAVKSLKANDDHLFSHILDSWSLPLIGYSYDSDCIYVNGTGASEYEFYIQLNRCGTLGGSDHQKKRDVAKNSEPTVSLRHYQVTLQKGAKIQIFETLIFWIIWITKKPQWQVTSILFLNATTLCPFVVFRAVIKIRKIRNFLFCFSLLNRILTAKTS